MSDHLTKIALVTIALGLWVNIAITLLRPAPLMAQDAALGRMEYQVATTENEVLGIYSGSCPNEKICLLNPYN